MLPHLLGVRGPGRAVVVGDTGGSGGVSDGGFVEQPVVTTTASGNTTVKGKVKPGSFGKFVMPLATIAAGRQYTFRYTPHFAQLAQQGKLAMVGFGLKTNNDFHIVGLRGDGSTGIHKYKVYGTPPNGWNAQTGHTTSDGGAAADGSQAGPNYIRLVVAADGATYKFQTSPDGATWTDEFTGAVPSPFSNVSGVTTFGLALWFNNADAGPFSIDIDQFADAAAPTYILDGKSPTGAWSMSRDLLSSFVGGTRYTTATGVSSLNDQTGNGRHFQQATTTLQPALATAGPNSRACMDFDGTDDVLVNLSNQTNLIANNASFIVVSCLIDTISTDNAGSATANCCVVGDPGGYTGLVLRSTGPSALAYNFDGNYDVTSLATIATATPLVLAVRHDSGTLYVSKNGGTEASVASGNTGDLAYKMQLGRSIGAWLDGKIFEIATFSTVPDSTTRAAIIADFMSQIGAV